MPPTLETAAGRHTPPRIGERAPTGRYGRGKHTTLLHISFRRRNGYHEAAERTGFSGARVPAKGDRPPRPRAEVRMPSIIERLETAEGQLAHVSTGLTRLKRGGDDIERARRLIIRAAVAKMLAAAKQGGGRPLEVAQRLYPGDGRLLKILSRMSSMTAFRAQVEPAMSVVPDWAGELADAGTVGMVQVLTPQSAYASLAGRGLQVQLSGKIKVPISVGSNSLFGFITEGEPVPVGELTLQGTPTQPYKVASISAYTAEVAKWSAPAIEGVIRQTMQRDFTVGVDAALLSANPANASRPAGLLNSAVQVPPSTSGAGGAGNLAADITSLLAALGDDLIDPVLICGTAEAARLSIWAPQLALPVLVSAQSPPGRLIAADAAEFVSGEAPLVIDAGKDATLHMEDTTPLPIVGGGATPVTASPVRSLWQTDSLALRAIGFISWRMRGPVAYIDGVVW
ncbi:phage major capsid protein [Sinorhizobium meliloti]|nr:phage major capsid protein [Sinorhizobium meliloti]